MKLQDSCDRRSVVCALNAMQSIKCWTTCAKKLLYDNEK